MPARKRKSKLLGHGSGHERHAAENAARRAEEIARRAASRVRSPSSKPVEVSRRRAEALRMIADEGLSYRRAAKVSGTSAYRLRKETRRLEIAAPSKPGRKVELIPEAYAGVTREMTTFSKGVELTVSLDRTEAQANAHYLNAVARAITPGKGAMVRRKDLADMSSGVTDVGGVFHPWEKSVSVLKKIASSPNFPVVYMIVKG